MPRPWRRARARLGPGANAAHVDHLHLDIKARRGGFRLCQ
ncbi:extensin family protein [Paracoccus sp. APAP_BH8]